MLELLERYKRASLNDLKELKLEGRTDKRFVLSKDLALKFIGKIDLDYSLLSVDGDVVTGYETNFYDTRDFELYNDHLYTGRDKLNIRVRNYSTSSCSHIDIKESTSGRKVNKYITEFNSIEKFTSIVEKLTPYKFNELEEKVTVHFNRFTFVNLKKREKVTIDLDLGFSTYNNVKSFCPIAIIEIKRDKKFCFSPVVKLLKQFKAKEYYFSKYCLAVSNMYQHMKSEEIEDKSHKLQFLLA